MVLESLLNPFRAEQHPRTAFFLGFLYSSIALFLSLWIFQEQASMVMVFLTTIASIPLIYNTIKYEEKKDVSSLPERTLLKEHGKALSFFLFLFIGITLSCAFWYVALPTENINYLFNVQMQTITSINSNVTGFSVQTFNLFTKILFNNLKVLIFCILFSFLYGVGAIFILTWNASVIGAAIGNTIRTEIYSLSSFLGITSLASYSKVISFGLMRYVIHGIPEILSYFVAGLAGGIISIAVIKHDFGTRKYEKILMDSSILLLLSFFLVIFAAFLEVFVTPLFIGAFFN
ncbi:stage II sporulation protein M [Candidatus Woesearchaeota archaeon]|nr:stage II sporulation protein M [Candidatus Woesearchaeota archaeon]